MADSNQKFRAAKRFVWQQTLLVKMSKIKKKGSEYFPDMFSDELKGSKFTKVIHDFKHISLSRHEKDWATSLEY